MKKMLLILLGILLLSIGYRVFIFQHLISQNLPNEDQSLYAEYQFSLPKSISFAGEKIPLENEEVRNRMIRLLVENTFNSSKNLTLHKLSGRWFPLIQKTLKKYKVPDDFKYLVLVESGFGNSVSSKGASGFWQFIPSTAENYGLIMNTEIDERYDVEKSTDAACRYILDCYKRFNNWTLTAASYNMGADALLKQMKKQKESSYYELMLNRETSVYLFKILAMKEIISRPLTYGYNVKKHQLYSPFPCRTVIIDSTITDLKQFASLNQTTLPMLRLMNPWLLGNSLTNPEHKKYRINILKEGFENLPGLNLETDSLIIKDSVAILIDTLSP